MCRGRKLITEFFLKDVANEIKKFEALLKKDLQAKERWGVNVLIITKLRSFLPVSFEYLVIVYLE